MRALRDVRQTPRHRLPASCPSSPIFDLASEVSLNVGAVDAALLARLTIPSSLVVLETGDEFSSPGGALGGRFLNDASCTPLLALQVRSPRFLRSASSSSSLLHGSTPLCSIGTGGGARTRMRSLLASSVTCQEDADRGAAYVRRQHAAEAVVKRSTGTRRVRVWLVDAANPDVGLANRDCV